VTSATLAVVVAIITGGVYAVVARCLRDSVPSERAEILRALAEVLAAVRSTRRRP